MSLEIDQKAKESHFGDKIKAALGIGDAREKEADRKLEKREFESEHGGKDYKQVNKEIKAVDTAVKDVRKEVAKFDMAADKQFHKDSLKRKEELNKSLSAIRDKFGVGNDITAHQMKDMNATFNKAEKGHQEQHEINKTQFRLGLDEKLTKVLEKNPHGADEWAKANPKDADLVNRDDDKKRHMALGMLDRLHSFVASVGNFVGKLLGVKEEEHVKGVSSPYRDPEQERAQQQSASPRQHQAAQQQEGGFLKVKLNENTEVFIDPKVAKDLNINHQTHPDTVSKLMKENKELADNTITHKLDDKGQVTDINFGAKVNAVTTSKVQGNHLEIKNGHLEKHTVDAGQKLIPATDKERALEASAQRGKEALGVGDDKINVNVKERGERLAPALENVFAIQKARMESNTPPATVKAKEDNPDVAASLQQQHVSPSRQGGMNEAQNKLFAEQAREMEAKIELAKSQGEDKKASNNLSATNVSAQQSNQPNREHPNPDMNKTVRRTVENKADLKWNAEENPSRQAAILRNEQEKAELNQRRSDSGVENKSIEARAKELGQIMAGHNPESAISKAARNNPAAENTQQHAPAGKPDLGVTPKDVEKMTEQLNQVATNRAKNAGKAESTKSSLPSTPSQGFMQRSGNGAAHQTSSPSSSPVAQSHASGKATPHL